MCIPPAPPNLSSSFSFLSDVRQIPNAKSVLWAGEQLYCLLPLLPFVILSSIMLSTRDCITGGSVSKSSNTCSSCLFANTECHEHMVQKDAYFYMLVSSHFIRLSIILFPFKCSIYSKQLYFSFLLNSTAIEITKMLKSISDSQIITAQKTAQAFSSSRDNINHNSSRMSKCLVVTTFQALPWQLYGQFLIYYS